MPVTGFEPVLRCRNCHLKTARLPIPPHGLCVEIEQCSRFGPPFKPTCPPLVPEVAPWKSPPEFTPEFILEVPSYATMNTVPEPAPAKAVSAAVSACLYASSLTHAPARPHRASTVIFVLL
jgi:hypothetical protein